MKKRLPKLKSDRVAEKLLEGDISQYINKNNFVHTTFEFEPKNKSISLRLSEDLLKAIQKASKKRGISYQKYIRLSLERVLSDS